TARPAVGATSRAPPDASKSSGAASMKRPPGLALVAAFLLAPLPARAEEPPHFDFVHGLRERRYFDLALEYLHKLQARTDLPAEVAARLPLEIARTQLDSAA